MKSHILCLLLIITLLVTITTGMTERERQNILRARAYFEEEERLRQ